MKTWKIILVLLIIGRSVYSQTSNTKVEEVLYDIEEQYQVRFSYSKDIVPYDEMVAVVLERKSLVEVLEELGAQTGIIYRKRGSRVVLNYDPDRKKSIDVDQSVQVSESFDEYQEQKLDSLAKPGVYPFNEEVAFVPRDTISKMSRLEQERQNTPLTYEQKYYEAEGLTLDVEEEVQFMQVSFLPARSLLNKKGGKINHFSFNILAGYTGGLQGVELGGIANAVKRDVQGVQLAGVTNYIGGNMEGIQLAGITNYNQGIMRGIQVGGVANVNVQSDAFQIAGVFNLNRRISRGYQVAGFFNAGRNITGGQLASFFNLSLGNVYFQGSGFCNVAENVDVQMSGLVNVAKTVDILQIGLINVADSVGGISFGLLNLIKKGYNKIELSVGDALYGNLAIKLGTRNFYNIFQVGSNFKRNILQNGITWAYGYGFGFFQKITDGLKFNPEVLVSNVQEKRIIRPDLNLLNQVKFLFHFSENRQIEVFAGPTINFMISKITAEDGTLIGSNISRFPLIERNLVNLIEPVNTKFWIGFNAGIRI